MNTPSSIFLVGPMGAGKSAVGRQLARLLNRDFVDADEEIENRTGVDVAYIFKNNEGIKRQVKAVEDNLKAFDTELTAKREQLKTSLEQLKTYQAGSADYTAQEEKVASMESKLRLDMARKRKELADREAKIYYDNYQLISAGVQAIAEYHKISLVSSK